MLICGNKITSAGVRGYWNMHLKSLKCVNFGKNAWDTHLSRFSAHPLCRIWHLYEHNFDVQHLYNITLLTSLTNWTFHFSTDLDFLVRTRPLHSQKGKHLDIIIVTSVAIIWIMNSYAYKCAYVYSSGSFRMRECSQFWAHGVWAGLIFLTRNWNPEQRWKQT